MPTAIVTDVRYRMSLAIIRDLAECGIKIIAVEHENLTPPLGFYSVKTDESYYFDNETYLDDLFNLCKREYDKTGLKPVLLPTSTATMNLLVEEDTLARFKSVAGLCLAKKEDLVFLNNKEEVLKLAEELGINVPKYDGTFPCIVKPVFGEKYGIKAKDRYKVAKNEEELKVFTNHFKSLCNGEDPIAQKYIDGAGYGFSVFAVDGSIISSICHKRIREYPISGGPSTCCESVDSAELKEAVSKIVKKIGFSGLAMFEFKQDKDGSFYILEVNPRVWGSYPLTRACNSSISLDWYKYSAALGNPNIALDLPKKEFKHKRMHFVLTDFRAGFSYIKHGRFGLGLGSVVDAINPNVKGGLFEFNDMKPAIKYFTGWLKKR